MLVGNVAITKISACLFITRRREISLPLIGQRELPTVFTWNYLKVIYLQNFCVAGADKIIAVNVPQFELEVFEIKLRSPRRKGNLF